MFRNRYPDLKCEERDRDHAIRGLNTIRIDLILSQVAQSGKRENGAHQSRSQNIGLLLFCALNMVTYFRLKTPFGNPEYGRFMWRLKNGYLPDSLTKNYHSNARTGFSSSLSRLESLKNFILFAGPCLWNDLPSAITSKPSLNSFSHALKNYLI